MESGDAVLYLSLRFLRYRDSVNKLNLQPVHARI